MKKLQETTRARNTLTALVVACVWFGTTAPHAVGAGLMKLKSGDPAAAVQIRTHAVRVVIDNGFSRTEVDQVFTNTADRDVEAVYTFPVPRQASLAELSLWIDGHEVIGEVVEKERAREVYEEQASQGNDTALAEKNDYKSFDVAVGRVRAMAEARVRLVYYQPLEIDLNVGRYVYPLAEGGVDDNRIPFWSVDDAIRETFSFHLTLRSAFPVKDLRAPAHVQDAVIRKLVGDGDADGAQGSGEVYTVTIDRGEGADLSRDVVVYYRLDDSVPARVEIVPYRASPKEAGTVMVVVTPAASLARIQEGSDWIFVLDRSGSMSGPKIATLAEGFAQVVGKMAPQDRFRVVFFNNQAEDITRGYVQATPENVQEWIARVRSVPATGGTALFAGLERAYAGLEEDRTTGVILVTDGVCNVGPTAHAEFLRLLRTFDVRLFTFVIGNSANQPLMDRLALESGGFAMNISDADDIVGRLLQAKAKVLHECMHDVRLTFGGERIRDLTPARVGSLYAGQQLVFFGRYSGSGPVELTMTARISGQEQSWTCRAELPEVDTASPELERLWALSRIEETMQVIRDEGETGARRKEIVELGTAYSLVTDYTSMLVVREDVMENLGVERRNASRVQRERVAQVQRAAAPVQSHRVDQGQSTFQGRSAPGIGTGPVGPLFVFLAAALGYLRLRGA